MSGLFRGPPEWKHPGGVNVNQQTAVVTKSDMPQTFEAMLTRVQSAIAIPVGAAVQASEESDQ